MDDEVLRAFYKFAHERSKHTTWANRFIIALVDEVVRLRLAYEGFVYHASEQAVKADALTPCPECSQNKESGMNYCAFCGRNLRTA